jgi:GNAT superfamily N-acetyltransferase
MQLSIEQSSAKDVNTILAFYDFARQYQSLVFPENVWPVFKTQLITDEIKRHHQWKLLGDGKIVCVWAITNNDPLIWGKKDADAALYIHRIATHLDYRGFHFVSHIVNWAKTYALAQNIEYLRLDTCGYNTRLIAHYKKCGFVFLGAAQLENSVGLPEHYQNADICYFELKL